MSDGWYAVLMFAAIALFIFAMGSIFGHYA
jgi:hypothetical protein